MRHLALQDPKQVPKPEDEATALHAHPNIGYPDLKMKQVPKPKYEALDSRLTLGHFSLE